MSFSRCVISPKNEIFFSSFHGLSVLLMKYPLPVSLTCVIQHGGWKYYTQNWSADIETNKPSLDQIEWNSDTSILQWQSNTSFMLIVGKKTHCWDVESSWCLFFTVVNIVIENVSSSFWDMKIFGQYFIARNRWMSIFSATLKFAYLLTETSITLEFIRPCLLIMSERRYWDIDKRR